MKFVESAPGDDELPLYIECTIYRKDRRVATSVREYMHEAHTSQGAWLTHPRRMLRHKAMVQCARACFGLGGVYEPDEAARIISIRLQRLTGSGTQTATTECVKAGQGSQVAMAKDLAKQQGSDYIKNFIKAHL
jgi:hypothetical protein